MYASMRPGAAGHGVVVRFSLGLEDVADLVADCERAMQALDRPT